MPRILGSKLQQLPVFFSDAWFLFPNKMCFIWIIFFILYFMKVLDASFYLLTFLHICWSIQVWMMVLDFWKASLGSMFGSVFEEYISCISVIVAAISDLFIFWFGWIPINDQDKYLHWVHEDFPGSARCIELILPTCLVVCSLQLKQKITLGSCILATFFFFQF